MENSKPIEESEDSDKIIIECEYYSHLIEVCNFSDGDPTDIEYNPEKLVCLSFYHTVGRKGFFKSLSERFRGACSYLFCGKAASVDVVLNEKSAKKLSNKINEIIQK